GLPDRSYYYLIGALVISDAQETFHSFWADRESEQSSIFSSFAETISRLREFRIFHFGDYDVTAMKRVAAGLPSGPRQQMDALVKNSINVLSLVHSHVYFPTYSNSLKDIGQHLSDQRAAYRATGLDSIIWRHEWETGNDPALKARLVDYNR